MEKLKNINGIGKLNNNLGNNHYLNGRFLESKECFIESVKCIREQIVILIKVGHGKLTEIKKHYNKIPRQLTEHELKFNLIHLYAILFNRMYQLSKVTTKLYYENREVI